MAEGSTQPRGELAAEKNPPKPARGGVMLGGTWVTARYQDGRLTLSLGGSATLANGLTAGATVDVPDADDRVMQALAAVLEEHGDQIEADALEAAYEARALARRRGDEGV
jgi:hypothetical protein